MGIYDRDYYRDRKGLSAFDGRMQISYVLAGALVCIFLMQLATRDNAMGRAGRGPSPLGQLFELRASKVADGEVYRLGTYSFVQDVSSPWGLIFNIFFLVWFGRQVEEMYGWKEFLAFYLIASFLAGLAYLALSLADRFDGALMGPASSVTAILFLYALHFPRRNVLLFLVIPCPIWLLVGLFVLNDAAGLLEGRFQPTVIGAHAMAACFALSYFHYSLRITNWLPGFPSRNAQSKPRTKLHVFRDESTSPRVAPTATGLPVSASVASSVHPPAPGAATLTANMDEHLEAKLDEILEKVKKNGQASLSEEERAVLFRASEIYRKRRKLGGD